MSAMASGAKKMAKKAANAVKKGAQAVAKAAKKIVQSGILPKVLKPIFMGLLKTKMRLKQADIDVLWEPVSNLIKGKFKEAAKFLERVSKWAPASSGLIVPNIIYVISRYVLGKKPGAGLETQVKLIIKGFTTACSSCERLFPQGEHTYFFSNQMGTVDPPFSNFTVYAARAKDGWWYELTKKLVAKAYPGRATRARFHPSYGARSCVYQGYWDGPGHCPLVPDEKKEDMYPASVGPPQCLAKMVMAVNVCSTCCCKGGLLSTPSMGTLMVNGSPSCKTWFLAIIEPMLKLLISSMRSVVSLISINEPCLEKTDKKTKLATSELGEAVGRRAGGGMASTGTMEIQSGGNRAGNDEALL
jgi:hypothetical protein